MRYIIIIIILINKGLTRLYSPCPVMELTTELVMMWMGDKNTDLEVTGVVHDCTNWTLPGIPWDKRQLTLSTQHSGLETPSECPSTPDHLWLTHGGSTNDVWNDICTFYEDLCGSKNGMCNDLSSKDMDTNDAHGHSWTPMDIHGYPHQEMLGER